MNSTDQKAKEIFLQLIRNVPPEDWEERVIAASAGDEDLRERVRALLRAHLAPDSVLDQTPPLDQSEPTLPLVAIEKTSAQIGPYKLLQQIGEGGMGVVYMAEQKVPVSRRVALKIIKPGMDTRQVIARFEAERQALAMMDHPNIAKVLDAGTTDQGSPYFVMELVQGIPLTRYCDQNKLSISERLELFIPVCQAVQHAHQKGIIHRDLKPSNVLVCLYDGRPVAKVIDFGLAKALQQQTKLTDKTMFTEFGQVVGTLQYMSPEQAEMNQLDVDTRTDIYSLGVMLYELLTGSTPIDQETLKQQALLQVLATIREKEPPRPSVRLGSSANDVVEGISQQRQIDPVKLQSILRGELDWIVMKALEKDRTRRYETASSLSKDIENYLTGNIVSARPPSIVYQFRKMLRRHRAAVLTATLLGATLLVGLLSTTSMSYRAWNAELEANRRARYAEIAEEIATEAQKEAEAQRDRASDLQDQAEKNALQAETSAANAFFQLARTRWDSGRSQEAKEILCKIPEKHRKFEWHFTNNEFNSASFKCYAHLDAVTDLVFSPDGNYFASASRDGTVKFWNPANGKEIRPSLQQIAGINCLAISPDGKRIASASSAAGLVKVWDVALGKELLTIESAAESFKNISFTPDGSEILVVEWNKGEVRVYDALNASLTRTLTPTEKEIHLELSPNGALYFLNHYAAGSSVTKFYSTVDNSLIATIESDGDEPLFFGADGKICARKGTENSEYQFLELASSENRKSLAVNGRVFAISSRGSTLAIVRDSPQSNRGVFIDASSGIEIGAWSPGLEYFDQQAYAFNPDGSLFVTGDQNGVVKFWDTRKQLCSQSKALSWNEVYTLSEDGNFVAESSSIVKCYDSETRQLKGHFVPHVHGSHTFSGPMDVSFDGGRLVLTTLVGSSVPGFMGVADELYQLGIIEQGDDRLPLLFEERQKGTDKVTFCGNGCRVVAAGPDSIMVWDAHSGQLLGSLTDSVQGSEQRFISVSFDGRKVGFASGDDTVKVWDVERDQISCTATSPNGPSQFALSPDGAYLVTLDNDSARAICLLDTSSGKSVASIASDQGEIEWIACSYDSTFVVSIDSYGDVAFWRTGDGEKIFSDKLDIDSLSHELRIQFSSDGKRVLAVSPAGLLVEWTIGNDEIPWAARRVLQASQAVQDSFDLVLSTSSKHFLEFSNETRVIVSGRHLPSKVFNALAPNEHLACAKFTPGNDRLILGSYDEKEENSTVRILEVKAEAALRDILRWQGRVRALAISSTPEYFAFGDERGNVWIGDLRRHNNSIRKVKLHFPVDLLEFDRTGKYLFVESKICEWKKGGFAVTDHSILVIDTERCEVVAAHPSSKTYLRNSSFQLGGDDVPLLAVMTINSSFEGAIEVIAVETGELVQTFPILFDLHSSNSLPGAFALSPSGEYLAYWNGTLRVWDVRAGKEKFCNFHLDSPWGSSRYCLAYNSDGTRIVVGKDQMLIVYDSSNGEELLQLPLSVGIDSIKFDLSDNLVGTSLQTFMSFRQSISFWEASRDLSETRVSISAPFAGFASNKDGTRIYTCGDGGVVTVVDRAASKVLHRWNSFKGDLELIALDASETRCACLDRKGIIRVWDMSSFVELASLEPEIYGAVPRTWESRGGRYGYAVQSINFGSGDDSVIEISARFSEESKVLMTKAWNWRTGELEIVKNKGSRSGNVSLSADGRWRVHKEGSSIVLVDLQHATQARMPLSGL